MIAKYLIFRIKSTIMNLMGPQNSNPFLTANPKKHVWFYIIAWKKIS